MSPALGFLRIEDITFIDEIVLNPRTIFRAKDLYQFYAAICILFGGERSLNTFIKRFPGMDDLWFRNMSAIEKCILEPESVNPKDRMIWHLNRLINRVDFDEGLALKT